MRKHPPWFFAILAVALMVLYAPMGAQANTTQPVDGERYATSVVKMTDVAQITMTAQTVTTDQMATQIAQTQSSQATPEDMIAGQAENTAKSGSTYAEPSWAKFEVTKGKALIDPTGGNSDRAIENAAMNPTNEQRGAVLKTCTVEVSNHQTNQDENTPAAWINTSEIERGQAPMQTTGEITGMALIICYGADNDGAYIATTLTGAESTPKPTVATTFEKETTGNALKTCTGADITPKASDETTATNADEDGAALLT